MANGWRECCQRFSEKISANRTVICKKWLLPLRIAAIGSLMLHILWLSFNPPQFYTFLFVLFHICVALLVLNACRRSAIYYQTIEELDLS